MSWRKRYQASYDETVFCLSADQSMLQIAFCPSLEKSYLNNSRVFSILIAKIYLIFSGNLNQDIIFGNDIFL